jgi:hypothetical protein
MEQRLAGQSRRTQTSSGLLLCHLQQRLFSSIEAFARTLRVHRRTVERQRETTAQSRDSARIDEEVLFKGVDADDERATLTDEELSAEFDAQVEAATKTAHTAPAHSPEQQLLIAMTDLAEASRNLPDPVTPILR